MNFVAFDVETANPDLSSICQVGIVVVENGSTVSTWNFLLDPEEDFDANNTRIHGIQKSNIKDSPNFPRVYEQLRDLLSTKVVLHHTAFDRTSLSRATTKHKLPPIQCQWLDTASIVRRTWPQFATSGYGLANVAKTLGIEFKHHAAHEDARAAAEIFLRAVSETGLGITDWLSRVRQPISGENGAGITRQGNPDGPLAGEVLVFTGSLSMSRSEAAFPAAEVGCNIGASVNKQTTLLVVGDQDIRQLAGREKSNKHRKAEELMVKGQLIRILTENDFLSLVKTCRDQA